MKCTVIWAVACLFACISLLPPESGPSLVHADEPSADSVPGVVEMKPEAGPSVQVDVGFMVPYVLTVPGSQVEIEMIPVPGGTFKLGANASDPAAFEDEMPEVEVNVGPMWVAKTETTWREYKLYMSMYGLFKTIGSQGLRKVDSSNLVDAVTAPTELYDPSYTYKFGEDPDLPAVTMTQFAAKQYTKWLSKLTGQQYRLPTEAEWEYACLAGANTVYHFGDDPAELDEYAWYLDNSDERPHEVATKKPNAFGLYDMHGNVMEWTIVGYTEDGYASVADKDQPMGVLESVRWPESFDMRVVRGGSWQDFPEDLRATARLGSEDDDWKLEDPNVPLSPWWYTSDPSRGVGFRVFRSYREFDQETLKKFWDIDNEDIEFDVEMRMTEGRGAQIVIDPSLAEDIQEAID